MLILSLKSNHLLSSRCKYFFNAARRLRALPGLLLLACSPPEQPVVATRVEVKVLHDTVYLPAPGPLPSSDTSYLELELAQCGLVDVRSLDSSIRVDLRYADTSNFLHRNFYDGLRRAYLPCEAALRLCNAQQYLRQLDPHLSLVVWDAARPLHVQQMMWDSLPMPPDRKYNYLSPPWERSLHNYGAAVDVTIIHLSDGRLLDMGTDFDTFEKLSQPAYEWQCLRSGELSRAAYDNRRLLRTVMTRAGFQGIASEWWHFSYGSKASAAAKFKLVW